MTRYCPRESGAAPASGLGATRDGAPPSPLTAIGVPPSMKGVAPGVGLRNGGVGSLALKGVGVGAPRPRVCRAWVRVEGARGWPVTATPARQSPPRHPPSAHRSLSHSKSSDDEARRKREKTREPRITRRALMIAGSRPRYSAQPEAAEPVSDLIDRFDAKPMKGEATLTDREARGSERFRARLADRRRSRPIDAAPCHPAPEFQNKKKGVSAFTTAPRIAARTHEGKLKIRGGGSSRRWSVVFFGRSSSFLAGATGVATPWPGYSSGKKGPPVSNSDTSIFFQGPREISRGKFSREGHSVVFRTERHGAR